MDSITYRKEILSGSDASDQLNQHVNHLMGLVLEKTNSCNNEHLIKWLRYYFTGLIPGIKKDLLEDSDFPIRRELQEQENTIYKNYSVLLKGTCCMPPMRIKDWVIGVDKIDHFFSHGLEFYLESKNMDLKGQLEYAKKQSESQEKNFFGLKTTGVYSRADIQSNLDGVRFWEEFFKSNKYIQCQKGKYTNKSMINMRDYISKDWDEFYNCNTYVSPGLLAHRNQYCFKK